MEIENTFAIRNQKLQALRVTLQKTNFFKRLLIFPDSEVAGITGHASDMSTPIVYIFKHGMAMDVHNAPSQRSRILGLLATKLKVQIGNFTAVSN